MSATTSSVTYREIPGFPGYRVGDDGSVWTRRNRWGLRDHWRRMKPWVTNKRSRHLWVELVGQTQSVHTLVLEAFVSPRPLGMECLHQDGDPANNRVSNLRWGTSAENAADRERHGRTAKGERAGRARLTEELVKAIRAEYDAGGIGQRRLARKFGIPEWTLRAVVERKSWKHVV